MKTMVRLCLALCVALLAAGCKQADRAISTKPLRAELPTFGVREPTLAARVGVEDVSHTPRVVVVPQYEAVELTPEEREALGEREQPDPDALLFYRPARGPEHGVSTEFFGLSVAAYGVGGTEVALTTSYPMSGSFGDAGHYYGETLFPRRGAGVCGPRTDTTGVTRPWTLTVGECLPRRPAARATRLEW
jgi:hypothetical protein